MDVKIVYTGPVTDDVRKGAEIASGFVPEGSYIDLPVFTKGHVCGVACGSAANGNLVAANDEAYGKSVYATNVRGNDSHRGLAPVASAPVNWAYFERAKISAYQAFVNGTTDEGITVKVDDNNQKELLWWTQIGPQMGDAGFIVTFTATALTTPATPPSKDEGDTEQVGG